jgi:hypothetical protein
MMIDGLLLGYCNATWVITDDDGYLHDDRVVVWVIIMDMFCLMMDHELLWQ